MRIMVVACAFLAACGGGAGGPGAGSVTATVDGQPWTVSGHGAVLTPVPGMTTFTITGYTPLPGSTKQADRSKPVLAIVFQAVPAAGSYDIATTPALSVMYWTDQNHVFGATEGTLVIAHITATAADGTFSFTATLAPSGPDTVVVANGSFSVPIGP